MTDFRQEILQFISQYVPLNTQEAEALFAVAGQQIFKKRDLLVKGGEVAHRIWFVRKGIVRFYHFNPQGDQVTSDFIFAPAFVTSYRSLITQQPSAVFVEAMEDIEAVGWEQRDLYALYEKYPHIERMGRLIAEQVFLESEKHLLAFLNQSPSQRYLWLIKEYPDFIRRIPLVYLASWLGITPETLSRIRKRTLR